MKSALNSASRQGLFFRCYNALMVDKPNTAESGKRWDRYKLDRWLAILLALLVSFAFLWTSLWFYRKMRDPPLHVAPPSESPGIIR